MSQTRRGFLIGVFGGMLYGVPDRVRSAYASTGSGLLYSDNKDLWGKVVLAMDTANRSKGDPPDIDRTRMLLDKAVEKLTGTPAPDGWLKFFHPNDKVALKINSLGGKNIATHPNVASALAEVSHRRGSEAVQYRHLGSQQPGTRKGGLQDQYERRRPPLFRYRQGRLRTFSYCARDRRVVFQPDPDQMGDRSWSTRPCSRTTTFPGSAFQ